jgi:hypothetical protein
MDVLEYLDKSIATFAADPPSNDYQSAHLATLKIVRAELAVILTEQIGECELCAKPLAHGQFVNVYDDVGTAHANCEAPFARPEQPTPAPADDGSTMPTYVLLGEPALLCDVADAVMLP